MFPILQVCAGEWTDLEIGLPEDLEGYQVHPLHVAVANEVIKPATCDRACFDYEY